MASYLIAVQKSNTEKATVYECGFDPFDDARVPAHGSPVGGITSVM